MREREDMYIVCDCAIYLLCLVSILSSLISSDVIPPNPRLAYISFLLGQNFDGFEQWRALLQLLCGCEGAALRRTEPCSFCLIGLMKKHYFFLSVDVMSRLVARLVDHTCLEHVLV